MKRALLAFVCTFALSAPAFAGAGFTFNFTNTNTNGAGVSIGNAAEAWQSAEPCRSRDGYRRAPGSDRHAHGRAIGRRWRFGAGFWLLCGEYQRERERCRGCSGHSLIRILVLVESKEKAPLSKSLDGGVSSGG